MPRKGRPRLVSSKASGTKLFVDDLREVIKLAQAAVKSREGLDGFLAQLGSYLPQA